MSTNGIDIYQLQRAQQQQQQQIADAQRQQQQEKQSIFNFTGCNPDNFNEGITWLPDNIEGAGQMLFAPLTITMNGIGAVLGGLLGACSPLFKLLGGIFGGFSGTSGADNGNGGNGGTSSTGNGADQTRNNPGSQRTDGTGSGSDSDNTPQTPQAPQTPQTPQTPQAPASTGAGARQDNTSAARVQNSPLQGTTSLNTGGAELISTTVAALVEEYNEATADVTRLNQDLAAALSEQSSAGDAEVSKAVLIRAQHTSTINYCTTKMNSLHKDIVAQRALLNDPNTPQDRKDDIQATITILEAEYKALEAKRNEAKTQMETDLASVENEKVKKSEVAAAKVADIREALALATRLQANAKANAEAASKEVLNGSSNNFSSAQTGFEVDTNGQPKTNVTDVSCNLQVSLGTSEEQRQAGFAKENGFVTRSLTFLNRKENETTDVDFTAQDNAAALAGQDAQRRTAAQQYIISQANNPDLATALSRLRITTTDNNGTITYNIPAGVTAQQIERALAAAKTDREQTAIAQQNGQLTAADIAALKAMYPNHPANTPYTEGQISSLNQQRQAALPSKDAVSADIDFTTMDTKTDGELALTYAALVNENTANGTLDFDKMRQRIVGASDIHPRDKARLIDMLAKEQGCTLTQDDIIRAKRDGYIHSFAYMSGAPGTEGSEAYRASAGHYAFLNNVHKNKHSLTDEDIKNICGVDNIQNGNYKYSYEDAENHLFEGAFGIRMNWKRKDASTCGYTYTTDNRVLCNLFGPNGQQIKWSHQLTSSELTNSDNLPTNYGETKMTYLIAWMTEKRGVTNMNN